MIRQVGDRIECRMVIFNKMGFDNMRNGEYNDCTVISGAKNVPVYG